VLKSYEDQSLKFAEMEKKLKNQNIRSEKQFKQMEEKYKEQIKQIYQSKTAEKPLLRDDDEDRVNVQYVILYSVRTVLYIIR
jgi:hypothetical protein